MLFSIDSKLWLFLEDYVYYIPPHPRTRPRDKPLEVICVGMPRTATESLQHALIRKILLAVYVTLTETVANYE